MAHFNRFRTQPHHSIVNQLLLVLVGFCWIFIPAFSQAAESFKIDGIEYKSNNQALVIQTSGLPKNFTETDYRFVRLKEPSPEFVLSLPRATMGNVGNRNLVISQQGLDSASIQQPSEYSGVLIRIKAKQFDSVKSAQIKISGSQIMVQFSPSLDAPIAQTPPKTPTTPITPISPGTTASSVFKPNLALSQLTGYQTQPGSIILSARAGDKLAVKNRMVLENPKRLVIDLGQTQIQNEGLKAPIKGIDTNINQVRIGQFDQETTRLVIETPHPELLTFSYPANANGQEKLLITVGSLGVQQYDTLPTESKEVGYIQDIWVEKAGPNRAIIRLSSSTSMAKALQRQGNLVTLQLVNLIGREAPVYFKKQDLPFINEIKVSPFQASEPNVRLLIKLNEEPKSITQFLSKDGKLLEVTLDNGGAPIASINPNQPLTNDLGPMPRAPGKKLIVVDAGHGGKDAGATREGIYEKNMTLSIALKLRDILQKMGYQVVMTRDVDKFLELSQITAITNKVQPDIFVSVHINSSTNPGLNGLETYYYHDRSLPLAKAVHKRMVAAINSKDNNVRRAKFYVINHTNVPAILCEVGYISNTTERTNMLTPQRQQATAEAIARGVTDYFQASK